MGFIKPVLSCGSQQMNLEIAMAIKLNAREKMQLKKSPKKVLMETDFAGIKAGQMMLVGTPMMVDAYVRKIPHGQTRTVRGMRNELARRNKCDAACPVSSSIFVKMVAQAAIEDLNEGKKPAEVAPFWRIISSEDKITKKLNIDPEWVDQQRALEASVN